MPTGKITFKNAPISHRWCENVCIICRKRLLKRLEPQYLSIAVVIVVLIHIFDNYRTSFDSPSTYINFLSLLIFSPICLNTNLPLLFLYLTKLLRCLFVGMYEIFPDSHTKLICVASHKK